MNARRAAAILALLAVCAGAWFACSSHGVSEAPRTDDKPVSAPARAPDPAPAPRAVPRRHADERTTEAEDEPATGNVINGHCVLRDGSPAVGARVRAWSVESMRHGESGELGKERVTGDDGAFTVRGAQKGDQIVMYAVLAGHHTAFIPTTLKIEWPEIDVTIRFGEGGVLTGRVVGPMGEPAGDVEVRLRPTERLAHTRDSGDWRLWAEPGIWDFYAATTRTDADGRYRFDGVPLPRDGVPQTRVPVVRVAEHDWAGEDVAFETDGQEIERDIVIGKKPWVDTPLPEPPQPEKHRVMGSVIGPEDKPLAGATVTYLEISGPRNVTWYGTRTNDDGRFAFDESVVKSTTKLEVRATANGYRTFRGAVPDGDRMEIRLEPVDHASLPGRIRGTARSADDKPLTGPIEVSTVDEMYRVHGVWVWADADGAFVLDGVAPGEWQCFLSWNDEWQTASVAEGGEARVDLRSHRDAEAFKAAPWVEEREDERNAVKRSIDVWITARREAVAEGKPTDAIEEKIEKLEQRRDAIDESRRASLPVREVLVTGLPKDAGVIVVAQDGGREWRSAAKDGAARFAGLSVEKWTFTLVRPGVADAEQEAEVVAGEGAQTVEFATR